MIFPPDFLDSSSCWNTNHNQLHQLQQIASNCTLNSPYSAPPASSAPHDGRSSNNPPSQHEGGGLAGGEGDGGGGADGPAKPMSMSERAQLARVLQPEPGLNCPCYNFNNYSLTGLNYPRYDSTNPNF